MGLKLGKETATGQLRGGLNSKEVKKPKRNFTSLLVVWYFPPDNNGTLANGALTF